MDRLYSKKLARVKLLARPDKCLWTFLAPVVRGRIRFCATSSGPNRRCFCYQWLQSRRRRWSAWRLEEQRAELSTGARQTALLQ